MKKSTFALLIALFLSFQAIKETYSQTYRKIVIRTDLYVNIVFEGPDKLPLASIKGDGASIYKILILNQCLK